jgi:hypothetical protein
MMQQQTDDEFKKALAFGMEGEEVVCKALLSMGVSALPLYQFAPEISPKILTAAARFNSPDLVCFGRKGAFFVEVKTKQTWGVDRATGLLVSGINKRHFDDYSAIEAQTGVPVYIAFNQREQAPTGVYLIALRKYNNIWDGLNRQGARVAQPIVQYAINQMKRIYE